jgi:2-keto-4-pentenoate hydratase/2-oxohepta-3-ene-1,7-dioic acid hydratase in catechol pathway
MSMRFQESVERVQHGIKFSMSFIRLTDSGERLTVSKIICVGQNYPEHVAEMNPGKAVLPTKPVIFLKPPSAIAHDGDTIVRPSASTDMHHEVEWIVAIGKSGKRISHADARGHILGYGVGVDFTLRDLQAEAKKSGMPWALAKGFDGSALISDIVIKEKIPSPENEPLSLTVNGTVRQTGRPSEMIFSIDRLIEFISEFMTLERGDVIYTGTPHGVGPLNRADQLTASFGEWTKVSATIDVE